MLISLTENFMFLGQRYVFVGSKSSVDITVDVNTVLALCQWCKVLPEVKKNPVMANSLYKFYLTQGNINQRRTETFFMRVAHKQSERPQGYEPWTDYLIFVVGHLMKWVVGLLDIECIDRHNDGQFLCSL